MKTRLFALYIIVLCLCVGCNDDLPDQSLNGTLSCNMQCKYDSGEKTLHNFTSVDYSYDSDTKTLTIKHINAGFNCCPDSLIAYFILSQNTLFINEIENNPKCNCNCLYDLNFIIQGVDPSTDSLWFIEPNIGTQNTLRFGIDLSNKKQGTVTLKRTQYPWN